MTLRAPVLCALAFAGANAIAQTASPLTPPPRVPDARAFSADAAPASAAQQRAMVRIPGGTYTIEHTSDPRAPATHFHAGQPKGDPARSGVDFQAERYQQVDGKHHIYYKK